MPIMVRPARPIDRDAVIDMLREFMDYLDAIESSEREPDLPATLADFSFGPDPVCSTLVAEDDGQPVGYVGYHPGCWEKYRAIYVISLFVRAEARGKGAGLALMNAVKEVARAHRATRITWEVWDKNPTAIAFYKSIGGSVYDDNLRMSLVVT